MLAEAPRSGRLLPSAGAAGGLCLVTVGRLFFVSLLLLRGVTAHRGASPSQARPLFVCYLCVWGAATPAWLSPWLWPSLGLR